MKTSWNNIKTIEQYLSGNLKTEEALLFKAKLLTDPALRLQVALQEKTYHLVRLFARKEIKAQLEITHRKLFRNSAKEAFTQSILQLFSKP